MIIHHPPSPRGPAGSIAATFLLFPLWLVVLSRLRDASDGIVWAAIITFVLSPSLGVLFWQGFVKREYVEEVRETERSREGKRRRRSRTGASRYALSRGDDPMFCRVVED